MRHKALSIKDDKNIVTFNYVQFQLFNLKRNNYDVVKYKFYL